jgi:Caspase domain
MRKALIVGIDHYSHIKSLSGCVNDAHAVKAVLERHADGTVNFVTPRLLTASGLADAVEKSQLKEAMRELFPVTRRLRLYTSQGTDTSRIPEDSSALVIAGQEMTDSLWRS